MMLRNLLISLKNKLLPVGTERDFQEIFKELVCCGQPLMLTA